MYKKEPLSSFCDADETRKLLEAIIVRVNPFPSKSTAKVVKN